MSPCPFITQLVTREHAQNYCPQLPLAAEAVLENTYMDDTLKSVENVDLGKSLYQELTKLWSQAGMQVRKWLSNSIEVLKIIPVEERAEQVDIESGELPISKTLGVTWIAKDDSFTFTSKLKYEGQLTKRSFLSLVSRIFDPVAFLVPFILQA